MKWYEYMGDVFGNSKTVLFVIICLPFVLNSFINLRMQCFFSITIVLCVCDQMHPEEIRKYNLSFTFEHLFVSVRIKSLSIPNATAVKCPFLISPVQCCQSSTIV